MKEVNMTLGKLKNKIYSILGVGADTAISSLCFVIDSALRKVSSICGGIRKSVLLTFSNEGNTVCADMPKDYMRGAFVTGKIGAEVTPVGDKLCLTALGAGTYTVVYYACPQEISEVTPDETELDTSEGISDTAAYGAAGELCPKLYPGDVRRYLEIMTEYDERIETVSENGTRAVIDSVFSRAGRMMR